MKSIFFTLLLLATVLFACAQSVEYKRFDATIKNDTLWVDFETGKEQMVKEFQILGRFFYDDAEVIKTLNSKATGGFSAAPLSYTSFNEIKYGKIIKAIVLLPFLMICVGKKPKRRLLKFPMAILLLCSGTLLLHACYPRENADIIYHKNKNRIFVKIRCQFANGTFQDSPEFEAIRK